MKLTPLLSIAALVGLLVAPGWSATLTTASYPNATLTPSVTFTDADVPIARIETSGKVTKRVFTSINLNRTGTAGGSVVGPYTVTGKFGYNSEDATRTEFYPQGMSTSSDSLGGSGLINNNYWIVQTWRGPSDSYLSLLLFNWNTKKYRWISLVEPYVSTNSVGADFREISRHGDGLVWYKNYLFVADACFGFMVFDTNHVWELASPNGPTGYDTAAGAFHANGRLYVMPKIGHYRYTAGWTCAPGAPALGGCFLDRVSATPNLVAWALNGNIIKWALDPATGLLALNGSNVAVPTGGWQFSVGSDRLFAATIVGSSMYVSLQPQGCVTSAQLFKFPVTGGTDNTSTPINSCTQAMVNDPYWNQIWMVSEAAGNKLTWSIRPP